MGKSLKGKELGVGISQRQDGLYTARFTDKKGKRHQKYSRKLQECRQWLADAEYADQHSGLGAGADMTVDAWFEYFIKEIKGNTVKPNTIWNYTNQYNGYIKKHLGDMPLREVTPIHCQNVLNQMSGQYCNSSIQQCRITMHTLFECAVEAELIIQNPVKKSVKCLSGKEPKSKRVLTAEEQRLFLAEAFGTRYYAQYAFVLQTGLRVGEMIGLKWSDIDFENDMLHIRRTMGYRRSQGGWYIGSPKSKQGQRDIPMSKECKRILLNQRNKINSLKTVNIEFSEFVFLNPEGKPETNIGYNTDLYKLADKLGIKRFSMHSLRHTFATRCIEGGMRPKTLQTLLGHSNINITMDLYVHVIDEEKKKEMERIEDILNVS